MTDRWPVVESAVEHENPFFDVESLRVRLPSGVTNEYYRVDVRREGAIGVAVREGRLVFVELYRPRLGGCFLELPGGGIDADEDPETAARREFVEETGYEADGTRYLGSFVHSPWTRTEQHVVWIEEVRAGTPSENREPEVRQTHEVPVERAFDRLVRQPTASWSITPLAIAAQAGLIDADWG